MRTLVKISVHVGYVDIPVENEKPNPYITNYGNNPRLFALDMEIVDSPDFEAGITQQMVFSKGQVVILGAS